MKYVWLLNSSTTKMSMLFMRWARDIYKCGRMGFRAFLQWAIKYHTSFMDQNEASTNWDFVQDSHLKRNLSSHQVAFLFRIHFLYSLVRLYGIFFFGVGQNGAIYFGGQHWCDDLFGFVLKLFMQILIRHTGKKHKIKNNNSFVWFFS